jgi:hypothetical protein
MHIHMSIKFHQGLLALGIPAKGSIPWTWFFGVIQWHLLLDQIAEVKDRLGAKHPADLLCAFFA